MKNNTIEAKAKEEKQRDFFTDLENWENSFYCNECGCDEITDFNYDRTVANGEVWYCKEHRHEVITGHKPNEDDNIYLEENPEAKQDEAAKSAIDFVRDVFIDDPDFRMADFPMGINEDAIVAAVHNAMAWQKRQSETKTKEFLDLLALLKQGNFCSVIGDEYINEILAKYQ